MNRSISLVKFCRATFRSLITLGVLLMLVLSSGPEGSAAGLLHDPLASHGGGSAVPDVVQEADAEVISAPVKSQAPSDSAKSVTACDAMCFGYVVPSYPREYVISVSVLLLLPLAELDVPGQAGTSIEKPPKFS